MAVAHIILPLPRNDKLLFRHMAHLFIEYSSVSELNEIVQDLREDYDSLEFVNCVDHHLRDPKK